MLTPILETRHPGEFILSEADGHLSRENVVIGISQTITPGTILGAATIVANETSSIIVGQNTGNGVATLAAPATSQGAMDGDYLITCTAAAANAGTFSVQTPDGREIGPLTVGAAFNKEIKLTIADGATDFIVGDSFVARIGIERPADYSFGALDLTATNGMQKAFGIALYPIITDGTTTGMISAMVRHAEVNGKCLNWPAGVTAPQQAAIIEQLRKAAIAVR